MLKPVLLLAALAALAPLTARAQVTASLVAADESVQAGKPLTLALRLEHRERWHTYWINAGTGYPTSIEWQLPPGWQASEIHWPTPEKIIDGKGQITGHGYDGIAYLPITVTAPRDLATGNVTLQAVARWLMCAEVCIPGKQAVSVALPVSHSTPRPNLRTRAALASMAMPRAADGWQVQAQRSETNIVLRVRGEGALSSPHFFSDDGFIQYDLPQVISQEERELEIALPIAADAAKDTSVLSGVLAYRDEDGAYRGVRIKTPFVAAGAGSSASGSGRSEAGLLVTMLLAFVGGLILNLMPCVFPVLALKVLGFVEEAGQRRRQVIQHALVFTLGVVLSFWFLATALAFLRAGGQQLGWGFQLQSAGFVFVLSIILLLFALSLSGVFELGVRATSAGSLVQGHRGYTGSFLTGVLATVVATPCSAPFLAPALGAALALRTDESFLVFTAIALGLSAPYVLLSIFPAALSALPRPGRWLETFRQAMAFPLYASAGYLVWVLAGQTSESGLLMAILGLTLVGLAAWVYGRNSTPGSTPMRARLGLAAAALVLAAGVMLGFPRAALPTDLVWEPWSNERVAELRAEGRPVYVDFTARWCATCQTNKRVVFSSEDVQRYFRTHRIATLKADWTNADPRITAELARWNRAAIPFNLVVRPGEAAPRVLPEVLTPRTVLRAFEGDE